MLEKLKKGEDFYRLAATKSIDSNSTIKSGEIGDGDYFTKDEILESYKGIENAIFKLNVGEVSDLLKSEAGYHIVLLEDKVDTYEDLKEDVISLLKNEKYIKALSNLRSIAEIKIYMDKTKGK